MFQKTLAVGALVMLLVGAPGGLVAQEREARGGAQASVLAWFSGLWSDFATWLAAGSAGDGRCSLDPNGCPDKSAAPAEPLAGSGSEGSCSLDPNGCPGGE